ncbi:1-acyl-sn-glycerol-3-phosphate acyltransferase [Planotetraspora sp. A-T 1434]|uniref:lysophospholipid acyltransferase family protein n=1 Tax=Planotetraspora sp. A-T 1434 TaxID=2979219 RepID=UPI0021C06344|nr:lysophospholipid acyltransferase family protein [Planotetraspora sp. A-T 1434]MCT9932501.1 1-acyl-sn-glycerol-3-phosphate acyltransferase [Planotetraspora sp. A-T 1434]
MNATSPWLPVSPCTPGACVDEPIVLAGPVRRAARLLGAVSVILAGLLLAPIAARRARLTMIWSRLLLRALGIRIDTRRAFAFMGGSVGGTVEAHAVPDGGTLLVGNHVSWLDPLVVAATTPSRLLAKREVGEWPLIRTLASGGGALFIDRDRLSALPEAVEAVAAALRAGDTVVAFPEGTTWCGREMGPFRPAVFQAAIDAGVPVQPMALRFLEGEGMSTAPCYVGEDTLLASILRVTAIRGLRAEVTLFPGVRLRHRGTHSGRPHEARRTLARVAEAQVRAGVVEPHRETLAAA